MAEGAKLIAEHGVPDFSSWSCPLPLVGYLGIGLGQGLTARPEFLKGMSETGYDVGRNMRIEYRWAESAAQMPALAADLARRRVAVIATPSTART